jgi:hypothetical protein
MNQALYAHMNNKRKRKKKKQNKTHTKDTINHFLRNVLAVFSVLLKVPVVKDQLFSLLLTFNFQYSADHTFAKTNKN